MVVAEREILGRAQERAELDRFLDDVARGSVELLIEGEPGVGKTILWHHTLETAAARGYRVLRCRTTETETKLSYVSLGDLFDGALDEVLPTLPDPQRRSLEITLLRVGSTNGAPDRRAVSVATLAGIRSLAGTSPLIIAIDDLQWLDAPTARIVDFVSRRMADEHVGILTTRRTDPGTGGPAERGPAVPTRRLLPLGPLGPEPIVRLLRERCGAELPRPVLLRIHEVSRGNPFFSLEIGRALLENGTRPHPGEALPISADLQTLVRSRLAALPPSAREVLPAIAATARVTPELIGSIIGPELARVGVAAARDAGVIQIDEGRVGFTHPLFASAVYADLAPQARRELHRRLSELVDDPEERARHLALATETTDANVAAALDQAAEIALARGAPDAAADLAELAIGLTPVGSTTSRPCYGPTVVLDGATERTAEAAIYHFQAGDVPRARALMDAAVAMAEPGPIRAGVLLRQSGITFNDVNRCAALLAQALGEAEGHRQLLTEIRCELSWVGILGGDLRGGVDHARRGLRIAEDIGDPHLIAIATTILAYADALRGRPSSELMDRAISLQEFLLGLGAVQGTASLCHGQLLTFAGDLHAARRVLEAERARLVDDGQESLMWECLASLAALECRAGSFELAARYASDAHEITLEVGHEQAMGPILASRGMVEALTGRIQDARRHAGEGFELSERHGDRFSEIECRCVLGFLELSVGNHADAIAYLAPLPNLLETMDVGEPGAFPFVPDLVEALVALGSLDEAGALVDGLEERGSALDRPLALATAARCRGLLAAARGDERGSADAFDAAIREHSRLPQPFELGRTLLVQGEAQRRSKQRKAARGSLSAAQEIFDRLGTPLWSERARGGLARIAGRRPAPAWRLTSAEAQIADLAAIGRTNREIAGELFISTKTVEANLSRVYRKLGVRSRRELRQETLLTRRPDA